MGNLIVLGIVAFFCLVLAYATYLSAREWSVLHCLKRRGLVSKAKVIELTQEKRGKGTATSSIMPFM